MTREIKFRAWNSVDKQMWEPELSALPTGWEDTLMQYTGLKDRHGVEIYEGDIIKPGQQTYWTSNAEEPQKITVVTWDDIQHYTPYAFNAGLSEVIGNTYENPELIPEEA
ncbi:YopX family protein [Rhodococcus ruber]|uniref:YopX family protein n=1 Tax=Rhodococcus ruber TaxID=1830 RepID=UPI001F451B4D|nr:YopX family protein [Rhodococcus ruber]MCF8783240.1 YopX family protein [Rhodococcus ruber]